jgi:TPR repeat protein
VTFLSAAASNAADVEQLALQAGLKKGGAAKGELVLAIFELANCFRHGWGIPKDPIAAKQYYETAANLGDTGMPPGHARRSRAKLTTLHHRRHERNSMVLFRRFWH